MKKKIAIVGPESTGKSTLSAKLAAHYTTEWVHEYAREYLNSINRPYNYDDLKLIAKGQIEEEDRKLEDVTDLLICDTTMLTLKIWSEYAFKKCDPLILNNLESRKYNLHLLCNIDLPWVSDPQREHPDKRKFFFDWYEKELKKQKLNYIIIEGKVGERFESAVKAIDKLLLNKL
ncbi:MAG: Trifunctional NAD biosynthesis/regulator protein NadR [Bacteroidia bacterium]|nr:Trifunctional NAD biosynthesis/regulator protein NadR [Bacteroidia bacterium]